MALNIHSQQFPTSDGTE